MGHYLEQLLGTDIRGFSHGVLTLEVKTGRRGTDTRLLGDILYRAHAVMRSIGLDPADTTALELYTALGSHADNAQLFTDTAWVGLVVDGQLVSFNHDDIITNRGVAFEQRINTGLHAALAAEFRSRYNRYATSSLDDAFDAMNLPKHVKKKSQVTESANPSVFVVGDTYEQTAIDLEGDAVHEIRYRGGKGQISLDTSGKITYPLQTVEVSAEAAGETAVSLARLGLDVSLMTWIGDDELGRRLRATMTRAGVALLDAAVSKGTLTSKSLQLRTAKNTVRVRGEHSYSYTWATPKKVPAWLVLAECHEHERLILRDVAVYLRDNPQVKFAFMPGAANHAAGRRSNTTLYDRADVVLMSVDDARAATERTSKNVAELIGVLHAMGASLTVLWDGRSLYASDYTRIWKIDHTIPDVDRFAEAIAAGAVAALSARHGASQALAWAHAAAVSVERTGKVDRTAVMNESAEIKEYQL